MKLKTALLGAAVLVGCDMIVPTDVCGCPPERPPVAVVKGTLTDAANQPVSSAMVHYIHLGVAPCPQGASSQTSYDLAQTTTTGQFFGEVGVSGPTGRRCYGIFATSGTPTVASDTQVVSFAMRATYQTPDSVEIALKLKSP